MATLILTTSCAPIKRPTDSSSHVNSATTTADDDHPSSAAVWSDSSSGCSFTTGRHADNNASDNVGNFYGGNNSCHDVSSSVITDSSSIVSSHPQGKNGGNTSHRKSHRQQQHDVEFLQALPLQCDITIIPRAHNDGDYLNATSLNSGDNNSNDDGIMNMIQPIRITKQRFHPCGVENIVRLAGVATTTASKMSSSSSLRNGDDKHDFILSLANCGVRIDNEGDDDRMKLPVQAVPSSFSFSYSGGEKHNVEEVAVSFDFSMAVDVYRQRAVANGAPPPSSAATLDHNNQSWNEDDNAWKGTTAKDSTTTTNIKTMEINSIMSTLEEESQFIKRTLVVLGSFGFGLLICMVWTIWKLERGRRARRNSRAVKRVFVDVPYEIIGTTTTTTNTKSRGVTSLRSNPSLRSHGKAHFPEEISPIRSSVSLNEAEEEEVEKTTDDRLTAAASDDRKGVHETLHLITPQAETNSDGSSHSNEGKSSSSPRHWYEDFLSPRGCSKKKKTPNNRSDTLFSEKEEVARSLFCSSSRSSSNNNKVSPRMDNEESFHKSKSKSAVSSALDAPKKKVIVSPIERSSLSPPPRSDVSLLKLSQDIESSNSSPLMVSTETEETLASSKTDEDGDEPPSSIEVTHKEEESCTISPVSVATTKESSGTNKPVGVLQVNTPKPKRSRTLKTPATDNISISSSSEESQFSTSQKTRKSFAEELAKKARMTPISTKSDFSRSIARRAAEVQTPKKTLKPLSASSSPPDDEPSPFLADYW